MSNCHANKDISALLPFLPYVAAQFYVIAILGIIGNCVCLWCVLTCPKTQSGTKVLLASVFVPLVPVCLVVMPSLAQIVVASYRCDRTWKTYISIDSLVFANDTIRLIERFSILLLAFYRLVAVWKPHQYHKVTSLRFTTPIVAIIWLYALLYVLLLSGVLGVSVVKEWTADQPWREENIQMALVNRLVPITITLVCYFTMLVLVKRQAGGQQEDKRDPATQKIMAVFFCTFLLGMPELVARLAPYHRSVLRVLSYMVYNLHLILDPLVFVFLNSRFRQNLLGRLRTFCSFPARDTTGPHATSQDHTKESAFLS